MLAIERYAEIEANYGDHIQRILPIDLDDQTLRLIIWLKDGSNLRITEQWEKKYLKRYSYYWLTKDNQLIIGWDNAPHHTSVTTHPHHKHLEKQNKIHPSDETCLEEVMNFILT